MRVTTKRNTRKQEGVIHCQCGTTHLFTISEPVLLVVIRCDCGKMVGWSEDKPTLTFVSEELRTAVMYD